MLKQGIKTINAELIQTHALFQLSFVQFRPYANSIPGLRLSVMLMPKSKKTLETSLDLTPTFKTSFDVRVEGLVSNVDYLENRHCNFIQKKFGRNRRLPRTQFFYTDFLHRSWLLKVKNKQIRFSPRRLNSFYYFFIFWFRRLSFKTQFKIEFWPPVNAGQLVLE